ncbi:MAG: hypothetical protein UU87_C0003G0020 [Parcubacteria group bacterium GW2011_GWA2_42_11]|nr:MAG: hypothetical protein UU87_C0003G0020 [Parcubacteria group bacterium GW2011_GWA2_42_11]
MKKSIKQETAFVLILHDIGCRLRCVFCSAHNFSSKKAADQIAKEQLNRLKKFCQEKIPDWLVVSGNDPGEYHGLIDFLKKIKKITPIKIDMQSHGLSFAKKSFLEEIIDIGNVGSFQIPLYGHTAVVHDTITKKPGSFNSVLKTLANLKRLGFPEVRLRTLFLKQNEQSWPELFKFLLGFGYSVNAALVSLPSYQGYYSPQALVNIPDLKKISVFFKSKDFSNLKNKQKLSFHNIPPCLTGTRFNNGTKIQKDVGGYDHFLNKKIDLIKINNSALAFYRLLSKTEHCQQCSLDKQCRGIPKPYIDLNLFKAKPFLKNS